MHTERSKIKSADLGGAQCFPFSREEKIHMHVPAMKYKLGNFSGSVWKLNALIFAFKTDTAQ